MAAKQITVTINLIGTGCTIVCGTIKTEYWKKIEQELLGTNATIEEFLCNENSLRYLGLDGLKTWKDISNEFSIRGMIDSSKSVIDLKIGDAKKTNIPFREILHQEILFSMYSQTRESKDITNKGEYTDKRVITVETEIGKLGAIKFAKPQFLIDKLIFHIIDVNVNNNVSYNVL